MLTLADWAKLIPQEKLRLEAQGVVEALSDPIKGFGLLRLLQYISTASETVAATYTDATTGAATRALNTTFAESSPPVSEFLFPLRASGGNLDLDRNVVSGFNGALNRAGLLTEKIQNVGARLFKLFFTGDKANADEFHGINELCVDLSLQLIAGANGATITSAMMDDLLDLVPGANLILANRKLATQIDGLNIGIQRTIDVNQGMPSPMVFRKHYKGVPILEVGTYPRTDNGNYEEILPFTETQGSSNVCSRVTAVRLGLDSFHGAQRTTPELDPPKITKEAENNHMNWFQTPVVLRRKDAIAQLIGVTES